MEETDSQTKPPVIPLWGQAAEGKNWKGSGSALGDHGKLEIGTCPQGLASLPGAPVCLSRSGACELRILFLWARTCCQTPPHSSRWHCSIQGQQLGHLGIIVHAGHSYPHHLWYKKPQTSAPPDPPGWWRGWTLACTLWAGQAGGAQWSGWGFTGWSHALLTLSWTCHPGVYVLCVLIVGIEFEIVSLASALWLLHNRCWIRFVRWINNTSKLF